MYVCFYIMTGSVFKSFFLCVMWQGMFTGAPSTTHLDI